MNQDQKPDQDAHQEDQKPNEEGKQNEDQNSNSEQDIVRPSNYIEFQDGNFTNRLVMDENGKIKITKNTAKFLINPFRYNDSGIKDIYLLDKNLKIEKNKIFVINPYKKPEDSYKVTYKFDGFKDINGKSELVIYVEKNSPLPELENLTDLFNEDGKTINGWKNEKTNELISGAKVTADITVVPNSIEEPTFNYIIDFTGVKIGSFELQDKFVVRNLDDQDAIYSIIDFLYKNDKAVVDFRGSSLIDFRNSYFERNSNVLEPVELKPEFGNLLTINLDYNGGTDRFGNTKISINLAENHVDFGFNESLVDQLLIANEGHTFKHWVDSEGKTYINEQVTTIIIKSIDLTAVWE